MNLLDKSLLLALAALMLVNTWWVIFESEAHVVARILWWVVVAFLFLWLGGIFNPPKEKKEKQIKKVNEKQIKKVNEKLH